MKTIAAGNEVAIETFGTLLAGGIVAEGDVRCGGVERVESDVRGFKEERTICIEAGTDLDVPATNGTSAFRLEWVGELA